MANILGINSVDFLQPYRADIRGVHQEVCGESDASPAALDRFLDDLGRNPDGPLMSFAFSIAIGRAPKQEVAAEYRRFLDGGRNCPEKSPGFAKWKAPTDAPLRSAAEMLGDAALRERYMAAVARVEDPLLYADIWNDYAVAVMQVAEQTLPALDALAQREAAGERPSADEVRKAIAPLEEAFSVSAVFLREGIGTFKGSWEQAYVEAARAKLGNNFNGILPWLGIIRGGNTKGIAIARMAKNVRMLFEPFDHLYESFSREIPSSMRKFLEVETPAQSLAIDPAAPSALRSIVDSIVMEAGRVREYDLPNTIIVSWDEAKRTIIFTDTSPGLHAFERFAGENSVAAQTLADAATGQGAGGKAIFDTDRETGRLTTIRIVVPKRGAAPTVVPEEIPASKETAETKPVPASFGGVEMLDDETEQKIEGTFGRVMSEEWEEASAAEQEAAIANLALYAQSAGDGIDGIADVVYRAALTCALTGAEMPLVRLR